MDLVANFALGRKIKTMSEDEKTSFSQLFEQNMILMWTLRFNEYQGQRIEFFDEKVSDNKKDVFVNSKIIDDKKVSDPAIDVVWRLRKTDDSYKIIDIIISNISMLKTYQSEYSAFLNQNGGEISALLNMLKEKNENYKKEMEKLKSKA
ncbi:MAG: Toluene tolerance, Ttg2 [Alphaproteobacteria bacterium ADurb.Bin438]|nr:MAG: Toluene tolerance, Ttg2 [Alphaproteobacteria bacterium ADurb.Bin438]